MTQGHIHQVGGVIVAYLRGFLPQAMSSWKGELQCRTLNRRAFLWRWGVAQGMFHPPNARSSRPGGINKMIKLKFKGATTYCLDPWSSGGRLVLLLPCFHWKQPNNEISMWSDILLTLCGLFKRKARLVVQWLGFWVFTALAWVRLRPSKLYGMAKRKKEKEESLTSNNSYKNEHIIKNH